MNNLLPWQRNFTSVQISEYGKSIIKLVIVLFSNTGILRTITNTRRRIFHFMSHKQHNIPVLSLIFVDCPRCLNLLHCNQTFFVFHQPKISTWNRFWNLRNTIYESRRQFRNFSLGRYVPGLAVWYKIALWERNFWRQTIYSFSDSWLLHHEDWILESPAIPAGLVCGRITASNIHHEVSIACKIAWLQ